MRAILLATILAGILAGEATAQTLQQQWAWCRGNNPDRLIRGCSAIIRSTKAAPDDLARALFNRGRGWSDQSQYDRAVQDFDRAIQIDPNYPDALNSRALALAGMGQYDRALKDFDRAIELDPNYAIAIFNRGLALRTMGRTEDADKDFARAKQVGPRFMPPKE